MSEITRMLARELERLREEDRRREEELTSDLTYLSRQLEEQRKRDEDMMRRLRRFAAGLSELERLSPSWRRRWSRSGARSGRSLNWMIRPRWRCESAPGRTAPKARTSGRPSPPEMPLTAELRRIPGAYSAHRPG